MAHRCISLILFSFFVFNILNIASAARRKRKADSCEECGIPPAIPKIMGGTEVKNGAKYPWIVGFIDLKEPEIMFCGGALISSTFVLTAAHCVNDLEMKDKDICKVETMPKECYRSPDSFKIGILVHPEKDIVMRKKVKRVIPHPEYNSESNVNDMALVQLQRKVDCQKLVKAICLPYEDLSEIGQTLIIAGRGFYDRNKGSKQMLMEGTINQVESKECLFPLTEDRHIICARGVDSDQASCQGDSGSAIFKKLDGDPRYFALGITSVGPDNCTSTDPDSYSDIFHYMKWIKRHVKNLPLSRREAEEKANEKTEEKKKNQKMEQEE